MEQPLTELHVNDSHREGQGQLVLSGDPKFYLLWPTALAVGIWFYHAVQPLDMAAETRDRRSTKVVAAHLWYGEEPNS